MSNTNNNQKINCTVSSCLYNNYYQKECELDQIEVAACQGCSNGTPEGESMCGSYRNKSYTNTNHTNINTNTNSNTATEQYFS